MGGECNPRVKGSCEEALAGYFGQLRTFEPPSWHQGEEAIRTHCHGEFLTSQEGDRQQLVHLQIRRDYPHHPSQIRFQGHEPATIDFTKTQGPVILMGAVSVFGNGDDNKWIASESRAGQAFVSLTPLNAQTLEKATTQCPDYSPVRSVSTMWSRDGDWSEALEAVGDLTEYIADQLGFDIPDLDDMHFPYEAWAWWIRWFPGATNRRYWGAWSAGATEIETIIVGGQPTHPPSEKKKESNVTNQCELGPWWQIYEYENRPMAALDGSDQGLPSDTKFLCVRALESEPTPFLQGAIAVDDLRTHGSIMLHHDALNPRNVMRVYGHNPDQQYDALENSLFTVSLRWQEPTGGEK